MEFIAKEKPLLQQKVEQVLKWSQQFPFQPNSQALLSTWRKQKADFIKKMGGHYTWEYPTPITLELDEESKKDKVDEFIDWVAHEYGQEMYDFFRMNYDSILENKLSVETFGFPVGMKLSRVLVKHFGIDAEDVRQRLSMLIQSNKVTGRLVISVHPLDFLSSSENQHNWRSCHALDGEYRSGNLSYMCDNVTFIAYIKSEEEVTLPRFPSTVPWNNKKWRCLFFRDYDNGQIWAGRQYPFFNSQALRYIADALMLLDYFAEDGTGSYLNSHPWVSRPQFFCDTLRGDVFLDDNRPKVFNDTYVFMGHDDIKMEKLRNYVHTDEEAMCYNDLIDSHTYAPYVLRYKNPTTWIPHNLQSFTIGAPAPCVCCGEKPIAYSDMMLCKQCLLYETDFEHEAIRHCDDCGRRILEEEAHYDMDTDLVYCDDCWEEHQPHSCSKCGVLCSPGKLYKDDNGLFYCRYCARKTGLLSSKHAHWIIPF